MPSYPHTTRTIAVSKVAALTKAGEKPIAAYRAVAIDMKIPAATIARWCKQAVANEARGTAARKQRAKSPSADAARRMTDTLRQNKERSEAQKPTLANYAAEYEDLIRVIPEYEEKLRTMSDRREWLRKAIAEQLGL